tara:strand:+ start:383 stop:1723 length:1341 start_codon:yes stop_codon:yes gene_type:complete
LDDKCLSGTCVDRCCREEVNGCNGHGACDETGSCLCEDGFNGNDCNSQNATEVEDITDASNINEEKKKLHETEQKQKEELMKSKKREETKKQQLNRKEEESKKQEEALEQNMKSAQKLEEAMKAGDPEAATKYTAKQEEIQKQKLKEEETKKSAEEMKKSSSEELIKQKSIAPKQVTPNEPMAAQMDTSNMTASEQGEIKVAELMQNLTKPGANVPKIAQSIITVSYNNSANVADEEAQTLEIQSNNKYEGIVEQKKSLERTIAQEEGVKGAIKQKEIESKENSLAADKVEKAEALVIENAERAKVVQNAQLKKGVADEKAAEAKAEIAKLQMQRETQAAHAEQNAADANILSQEMAKETLEQEAEKKKATAEALAKEQEVTDLKTLHTETDLAKEAAKKEELQKEISDTDATTGALNEAGSALASDKAVRQKVVDTADSAVATRL